jgi:hypothetical protein
MVIKLQVFGVVVTLHLDGIFRHFGHCPARDAPTSPALVRTLADVDLVAEDRYSHSPPPEIAEFPLRLQGAFVRPGVINIRPHLATPLGCPLPRPERKFYRLGRCARSGPLGKTTKGSRPASMLPLQTLNQSVIEQSHQEPYGHRLARALSACRVVRHSEIWWIRSRLSRR